MQDLLTAIQRVFEDPARNASAVAAGIAIVVLFVILVVLVLIAVAMPNTRPRTEDGEDEPSRPRKKMPKWLYLLLGGVITLIGVGGALVVWYQTTSASDYCGKTCHSMNAAAQSWSASAHSAVPCTRCHEGRHWETLGRGVKWRTYCLYLEVTGGESVTRRVSRDVCLSCHAYVVRKPVVARNGETFTHDEVLEERAGCVSCHGAQGHEPESY